MKEKLDSGELTSEAIVLDCLERIKARDGRIGAWKFIDPDYALRQAVALDNMPNKGLLHGIPIGIKDNLDTIDMPTEYGTSFYPEFQPTKDSATVAAIRDAGAVILGKTITSEFAGPYPGPTLNPHDTSRSPGVSSMGSAAGVADYMIPLANGTQTGGSVIRPAALCGVYGYKASFSHLDATGIRHLKKSIDTLGHFARSLDDLELLRCVLTGTTFEPLNSGDVKNPRIGICKTDQWHAAKPETIKMIEACHSLLNTSGSTVDEIELPASFSKVMERSYDVIRLKEYLGAHGNDIEHHFEKFNPWFKGALKQARQFSQNDYIEALEEAESVRMELRIIFKDVDILITPSALGEAPKDLTNIEKHNFNYLWTLMYTPCVNIPAFNGPNNLPVGLQIVGPQDQDRRTLEVSGWVDQTIANYYGMYPVSLYQ